MPKAKQKLQKLPKKKQEVSDIKSDWYQTSIINTGCQKSVEYCLYDQMDKNFESKSLMHF